MERKRLVAYLALTITSLVWSVGAVLIKYSLYYTSPLTFLFWRFLIVSLVFLPLVVARIKQEHLTLKDIPLLSFLGILATSLTLGILFWGMSLTSAVEAIIINALAPIFIIVGGALFLNEKITKMEKIGALFAFVGSLLTIVQPLIGNREPASLNLKGNILVFISVIVWAVYSLLARKYEGKKKFSPILLTGSSFMVGLITITPFFLLERLTFIDWQKSIYLQPESIFYVDPQALPGIIFMALLGSCIAYFTYNLGFALIEASEATIFTYLQPVFAIPLALFWLKESVNNWVIIGAIFILIGVVITEYKTRKRIKLKLGEKQVTLN